MWNICITWKRILFLRFIFHWASFYFSSGGNWNALSGRGIKLFTGCIIFIMIMISQLLLTSSSEYIGIRGCTLEHIGVLNTSSEFSGITRTRRHQSCLYWNLHHLFILEEKREHSMEKEINIYSTICLLRHYC